MISSLFIVPDSLSLRGHKCYVLSDVEKGGVTKNGVTWYQSTNMTIEEREREYDVVVYNRQILDGLPELRTKHRILWTHDLPHHGFIPNPKTIKAFAYTVFMSKYAERVWRKYYLTIGNSCVIPNGVDKTIFFPREKDHDLILFCSAPNRGLKHLPLIYRSLKQRIHSDLVLIAYSNMKLLHPESNRKEYDKVGFFGGNDETHKDAYKQCIAAGIDLRNPVPQPILAEMLGQAGLLIMPTEYPEICSNIVLQSLASGTPIITTGGIGSAEEWIKNWKNGFVTEFKPHDYWVCYLEMVRAIIKILNTRILHNRLIRNAGRTKVLTWQEVGKSWDRMLSKLT